MVIVILLLLFAVIYLLFKIFSNDSDDMDRGKQLENLLKDSYAKDNELADIKVVQKIESMEKALKTGKGKKVKLKDVIGE